MAAKGIGLLVAAAVAGLMLYSGKASATPGAPAKPAKGRDCADVAATQVTDFIIQTQRSGFAPPGSVETLANLLQEGGSPAAAQCVRDNASDLQQCRQLLIDAMKTDLKISTAEQLRAQADMIEAGGGPPAAVACLRELANSR